jgi:hypothetical protein
MSWGRAATKPSTVAHQALDPIPTRQHDKATTSRVAKKQNPKITSHMLRPAQTTVTTMDSQAPTNSDGDQGRWANSISPFLLSIPKYLFFLMDGWMDHGSWMSACRCSDVWNLDCLCYMLVPSYPLIGDGDPLGTRNLNRDGYEMSFVPMMGMGMDQTWWGWVWDAITRWGIPHWHL